jgi:hypothetical protein
MNDPHIPAPLALDPALTPLRAGAIRPQPVFAGGADVTWLGAPGGLSLRRDAQVRILGDWDSPPGRLVGLRLRIAVPGRFLSLHLPLTPLTRDPDTRVVLIAGLTAAHALPVQPVLRTGAGRNRRDLHFPRVIVARSRLADHVDLLVPAAWPDLSATALSDPLAPPELILFLPCAPGELTVTLHHLRIIAA